MKNSHWVPQSYLRHFAADPDRREKIWRFGKTDGDPECQPARKTDQLPASNFDQGRTVI